MADPRTDIFTAAGAALHQWSGVEFALAGLFEIISTIPDTNRSNAAFDAIISFEARLGVLDALMALETLSELERETWIKFSLKLRKKYQKRHEIAHFTIDPHTNPPTLIPFFSYGKHIRKEAKHLRISDVQTRQKTFSDLREASNWFKWEAMRRRGLIPDNPMPMTQTVLRCQESAAQTLADKARKQQSSPGLSQPEDGGG